MGGPPLGRGAVGESRADGGSGLGRLPRRGENPDHAEAHANSYLATGVIGDGTWPPGDRTTPFSARVARDHLLMIIPRP
jgi:hypothetical protein